MNTKRAFTLLELLVSVTLIVVLATMMISALGHVLRDSRLRLKRVAAWHSMRVGTFLDDNAPASTLMWAATNTQLPYLDVSTNTILGR